MTFLSGFDTSGVRGVRLISVTLGGPGRHSVVSACVIEVEREQGEEEVTVEFSEDQAPALASLEALIAVLNKSLGGQ